MTKRSLVILILTFLFYFSALSARSYRVSMVPYGDKWSCNTCHTAGGGTPRNPFGSAVESITGSAETPFWGAALSVLDSDGDGFENGVELQDSAGTWTSGSTNPGNAALVTHPGDASDYPAGSSISRLPAIFELGQNFPNPFNPLTSIRFDLPVGSEVKIEIINTLGKRITTLVDQYVSTGSYVAIWNGCYDNGTTAESGIYFYKMTAGDFSDVKRMLLVK